MAYVSGVNNMKYKLQKDGDIINIINKAIKTLNNKKGSKFKLIETKFSAGVDDKYGTEGQLDTAITVNIKDTTTNKYMKLFWYKSFFNADLPDDKDEISGVSKMSKPEDKILLRVAYSIWSSRHWMSEPQTKKRKII